MRELSLTILDIITNSIEAKASRIILSLEESIRENFYCFRVRDNGCGMSIEMVKKATDPFMTTRSTRPVGMGLALLNQATEECGGSLQIKSYPHRGTCIIATFQHNHLNRAPLGDITSTMINLIVSFPERHFYYLHKTDYGNFHFDSYWFLARIAETASSIYEMVIPAKKYIQNGLERISFSS